jgi:predicted transcriptional regulator
MSHGSQKNGNTARARAYFEANPTATITPNELARLLDLTKTQAYGVVRNLKIQGFCEAHYVIRKKERP